ncbi:Vacuolar cation/proton exchanger 5 [Emydomyces testavorans]|uniref:Vacuolar cation/proton exchanger 5 n=1 Tax=Emydomyces testavorans TaxID=2070801 RepID=A0AAF0DFZ9_9EURO|nr:Vacuolar cation/proton exchanger 5 [Emydomyces testavorans]
MDKEVVSAFKDRNIQFKYEDIRAALADSGTRDWVVKHLNDDTLLSKEEITLYSKLEASGALNAVLQGVDVSSTRPILDDEIRTAIESLKASTAAIDSQTEALRRQCKELKSQIREVSQAEQQRSKSTARLSTGHTAEKQRIDLAMEDLVHEFEEKLQAAQKALVADQNNLPSITSNLLREHDAVFRSMEKLVLNSQSAENNELLRKRINDLSVFLAKYIAEEVNCRLDRVFLETVANSQSMEDDDPQVSEQLESVEAEVSSLYPEISVLAEMAARQQFQSPILRVLEEVQEQSQFVAEEQLQHVLETMIQLTESTEQFTEMLKNRQVHHSTLNSLAVSYQTEISSHQLPKAKPENKRLSRHSSRLSQAYASPREITREKSNAAGEQSLQSLETMLRRFGISLSSLQNAGSTEAVNDILNEKRLRMLETLENNYAIAASPLLPDLDSADKAAQLLSSAMYCDSDFELSLVDKAQQQRTAELETQIGTVSKGVEGLNVDILHQSDRARESFMETWGNRA